MKASDAMTANLHWARPETRLLEAASKMSEQGVSMLAVVQDHSIVGVVTDRDLTTKCAALGHSASGLRVVDVMQPTVYACDAEDDVIDAGRKMIDQRVTELVVKSDSKAVGLLTLADVARACDDAQLVRDIVVSAS